jgi:dipeptidyl aminopeptidase/acylaminoacyl peptidase
MGYQPGRKYPLVVEIHGGPEDLFMDKWYGFLFNNNVLNARGAFVFRPNYHGSSNYGLKWAESIIGRLNKLEVVDIEKGVDYLIHRGLVDPEKLAVTGWSQGGTLVAAVTVATRRYKAAVSATGAVDWIDYWAKSDIGGWLCGSYFGKTPLEDPILYVRHSSFYRLGKVTTPTLILYGMEDTRCPVEQGWMYYRALQQTGKADVRFILFPGDGHAPLHHARRAVEEPLTWLDKYLFKNARENDNSSGKSGR